MENHVSAKNLMLKLLNNNMERGAKIKFRIASGDFVGYVQDPNWNGSTSIWVSENQDPQHIFSGANWAIRPSDVLEIIKPKRYVLGFLFDSKKMVWLIRKTKPEWQKGLLNGIGGKIEDGETPFQAMCREFKEEADLDIDSWKHFANLTDTFGYDVYCFYAHSDKIGRSMTEELIGRYHLNYVNETDLVIPNLKWLIPMALSFDNGETAKRFVIKSVVD